MKDFFKAEQIELIHSGNNFFDILERLIEESKEIIHFQTYIFDSDQTGFRIIEALKRAVKRNVQVCLLVDAFGSNALSKEAVNDLLSGGVKFRKYSPLFSSESIYFGRRLHYKILVVDKSISVTGGINVADKYNAVEGNDPWLDYAVLVKGQVCEYLHVLCETTYSRKYNSPLRLWEKRMNNVLGGEHKSRVSFRLNDWIKRKNEINASYARQISNAKKSIIIVSSYFLPSRKFRSLLTKAVRRGVNVKIILAGKSDVSSVRNAEVFLYSFYLRNKISLYEWNASVMHGKAMTVDGEWSTIGSFNINFLSKYISIELNTDVIDKNFTATFETHLNSIISNSCELINADSHKKRSNWLYLFKLWLAYNFYGILKGVFVKRREKII